ncbi:metallophosphatase family protein [Actimicrobium sp. CCI2.3]|uniref:metallophosphoesterase family protein n=1 Tax=Actimicrobium sp. CCI2.3 TaxID=3048616 RepID=UPI002AB4B9B4|nr:metallophosphatase family protein [Actimicrobium sp. CCI2.3]MDY7574483.1 metallophosphatase family protein [Actimicrobium sp. CCI2.3]MEB0023910.1 metallophosphatase family protein [Actimicrobium sp. CCI2.3]
MIRLAHFSDLHYASKNLIEADRCFGFAIDAAIQYGVDCAVVSGDATDHALDVHAPAFVALATQLRRLADHCPVLMLQGTFSHEPPGTLDIFRLLGGRYPVFVADRIGQVALIGGRWQAAPSWRFDALPDGTEALFSCVPTVNKAQVAATVGACEAANATGEHLARVLRGFASLNDDARRRGIPTIGVSHGTVNGCVTEHGVPMAGPDHEFTTGSLFAAGASAFLLGHIHQHQQWKQDGRCIAYAGSIGRFHYGEHGIKGFLLWHIDAASSDCTLNATPARRTIDITFDGLPDMAELALIAKRDDVADTFIRLRWQVPEEDRHQVDRTAIRRLLRDAAEVKFEGRLLPVVRTRAAGIARAAGLVAKVNAWAEVTQVHAEPLQACLQALQCGTPEEIAMHILGQDNPLTNPAISRC